MARAGAVFIDVLPSLQNWNAAVRTQAAVSLEGVGAASGKGFTAGLMRAVKSGNMASIVEGQARVAADKAATAVEAASAKVILARKREADASGAVRVAETKLADLRAKENASAGSLAAAEERLARAQRAQAAAADVSAVAGKGLAAAQARAAEATTAISTESAVATGRFSAMGAAVTGGATRMTSKLGGLAKGVAAMGGLFAGFEVAKFAGESVHAAMDFQKGSQVLQTAAGELPKNLGMVRSGLMAISSETGTTLAQMVEGMYTVEKAGIRGSKGLDVMRAAAKGAKDEGADLGIVTNALTTVMTTSNGKITNASKGMNALMVAAGHSKTTLQEFAGSLSSVLPLASKVGIGFDQVAGAISAMAAQGMSAQQATQDLNHVIASLATPTKVMATEMDMFGLNASSVRDKLGKRGLQGTIEYLSAAIKDKLGPSAKHALDALKSLPAPAQDLASQFQRGLLTPIQYTKKVGSLKIDNKAAPDSVKAALLAAGPAMTGYTQALSKMTGGQMGLTTALMLTGHNAKQFTEATKDVGKAMNSTADFDKKWNITSGTTATQLSKAKQSISNVGTALATNLLPAIGTAAQGFATATMAVSKFTQQNWGWLKPVAKIIMTVVGAIWAMNFALDANPIGLVIAAIAALAIGLVVAYHKVGWFQAAVDVAFHAVGAAIGFVKDHWKVFLTVFLAGFGPIGIAIGLIITHFGSFKSAAVTAFKVVVDAFLGLVGGIVNGAATAFGWVPGLGGKLKAAAAQFNSFRDSVNAALDGIHAQKDIHLNVTTKQIVLNPSLGKPRVVHPYTGGRIIGPGTGTSDSIPAMISNGEYVIRAAAVDHYGSAIFDQLNGMRFAGGGRVGGRTPRSIGGETTIIVNDRSGDPVRTASEVSRRQRWASVR